jgi:LL-diaminopimelate aminotransferase
MITLNENYLKLQASYLFTTISRKVEAYQKAHPEKNIIRLGIGDVTLPLSKTIVEAFHRGVDELAHAETFRGYGPEQGYAFLREAIAKNDFQARGAAIEAHEIVVSDGSKCDTGNFQELLGDQLRIGIPDPVYPVYVDTNVMAGRTGPSNEGRYDGLFYLEGNHANGFVPSPPDYPLDLIYLCFPNNPTGAVATRGQLQAWVDYARGPDPVRCCLQCLCPRPSDPGVHLRNSRSPRVRGRVPVVFQDRRLHRHPLRLHGDPRHSAGVRRCWQRPQAAGSVEPTS